ncbi:TrbL/VirB6 plasmid conjugal transfer protein [compost metagenome]
MCVGTMVVLKFATSIILVVGPIFIALALFDATRQWFWSWVSTLSGFMLTHVFFAVAIGIEINYITNFILVNGGMDTSLMGAFEILVVFAAFTLLATKLPDYASSIMGAAASGGMDLPGVPGAQRAAKVLGSGAKSGGKAVGLFVAKRMNRNRIE